MGIERLEQDVIRWASDRRLYQNSTDRARFEKFFEEIEELVDEMFPPDGSMPDMEKVRMEAGDVLVTIVNLLHPMGLDLETCLQAAYEKIKDRTGRMENGTFVRAK